MRSIFVIGLLLTATPMLRAADAEPKIDFQRQIRSILSDTCFVCHGPDAGSRKAKLRLDMRDFALKGGSSGNPAFVPGKAAESLLIARLRSHDVEEVMPPPKTGKTISPAQIALIERWIDQGADYQTHWGFLPPQRPPLPNVKDAIWGKLAIDRFVLARLEKEGMTPAKAATKTTLIRRLSLDLTGLPPTIPEIDGFLGDDQPGATERLVDRLLASPHYGERWGRHWLDGARYADSDGYEKDKPRSVWMYRDWVVNAINRDLPYNQFLIEQLAGDLLPNATQDQRVATGFLRNSMINEEGGIDPEQFRMEAMFDRMDAIGKSMLGVTINCCQCHAHKYDPITHDEYYKLFAYLNDTHEASITAYGPAEMTRRTDILRKIREIEDDLKHRDPLWREKLSAWREQFRKDQPSWTVVPVENQNDNSQRYVANADGSLTAGGYAPTKWTSTFTGSTKVAKIGGIRLEMLLDAELPLRGPGRSPIGLFALSEFTLEVAPVANPLQFTKIKLISATSDYEQPERPLDATYDDRSGKKRITGPIAFAIDGKDDTAWGVDAGPGRRNVDRKAVFVPEKPIEIAGGMILKVSFKQLHGGWNSDDNQNNNLGRFRISVTDAPNPVADPLPRPLRFALDSGMAMTLTQDDAFFAIYRLGVADWKDANDRIETLWQSHPEGASQLAMASRVDHRKTFVLDRGDFLKPSRQVVAGVPAILNPTGAKIGESRLDLARWLASEQSPTTARSLVNRVWQAYFGTGLVASSEDLGTQSDSPSHPELLDYLAVEFVESGWSMKKLHRMIVLSNVYQQSSAVSPEAWKLDPANRLLGRGARFRMEGEAIRDTALTASGLLNRQVGGAPVYPPAPGFLFLPPSSYGPKVWNEAKDGQRYRRALYTFRFRSVPYPVLTNFDTPNGDASCVRRVRSNTPLQALTMLNETIFLEAARAMAMTLLKAGTDDKTMLENAFRRATGRMPTDAERKIMLSFVAAQAKKFSSADAKPWELAADDPAHPPALPDHVTVAQAAAWTALCRLILNLDETLTKE